MEGRSMDGHALEVLEFPAVVRRVEAATETELGAELARALAPSPDGVEVERAQRLTSEAISLLDAGAAPSLAGVADVRDAAQLAGRDGTLAPSALRAVAGSIAVGLEVRRLLGDAEVDAPLLRELADPIAPGLAAVADTVDRMVEEDGGDLRDHATPQLRRLRTRVREARARIADDIARLARSSELRDHLQEQFVTERGGRPVLAVKANARGSVPGIVHDASGSGQTLFVEPFAIVELNNVLAEAAGAEREEVDRILRELSALVGSRSPELIALVEAAAAIDLALARGSVSRRWRGAPVTVADEVCLLGARHPLLDERSVVPVDLDLGELRALVVSGPNTGGKTVALKTLGLAALLHQSGLRPPADAARLPVFDRILADIGDEQSIEMSLSTFSAHLRTMVAILGAATERSLVLLDEVAGGTDPVEGSALAQALVAQLARQARLTAVTTHYAELKEWASSEHHVANAATALDPATNEPLYTLALGRPGTSHALGTAERLGLDPAVVADARTRIEPERLRTTALLAEAEAAARRAVEARAAAEAEHAESVRLQAQLRSREEELAREVAAVRASAARERTLAIAAAARDLAEAHGEIEAMRADLRAARRDEGVRRRAADQAERGAERKRDRRLGSATDRYTRADAILGELDEPVALTAPLGPGDPVEAPDVGVRGTLASVEGDEAEVVGPGGFRVRIPLARLRAAGRREQTELEQPAVRVIASARGDVSDELDVRGLRAQEARESVRAFVDDAALAGLAEVRIVHGRGTGAVRSAVREELTSHQLVEGHETDSRDGATLVRLS